MPLLHKNVVLSTRPPVLRNRGTFTFIVRDCAGGMGGKPGGVCVDRQRKCAILLVETFEFQGVCHEEIHNAGGYAGAV